MKHYYKLQRMLAGFMFFTACGPEGAYRYGCDSNCADSEYYLSTVKELKRLENTKGYDVNKQCPKKQTRLMEAAKWGQLEVAKQLLKDPNINVNLQNEHGETALMQALNSCNTHAFERKKKIAELLINREDIDLGIPDYVGKTAAMYCVVPENRRDILKRMLDDEKININDQTPPPDQSKRFRLAEPKSTLLMYAVFVGDVKAVEFLLDYTPDLTLQNKNKQTALHILLDRKDLKAGHVKIASSLIKNMKPDQIEKYSEYARNKRPNSFLPKGTREKVVGVGSRLIRNLTKSRRGRANTAATAATIQSAEQGTSALEQIIRLLDTAMENEL